MLKLYCSENEFNTMLELSEYFRSGKFNMKQLILCSTQIQHVRSNTNM